MAGSIIHLNRDPAGFATCADSLDPHMFDSELPVQHTHLYHEDDNRGFYVGVWDTTAMVERASPYPCDEFMWLLEGEAAIENSATGEVQTARAGEAFIIPRGYHCRWRQRGYLRKFFVILEPPEVALPNPPAVTGIIKPATSGGHNSAREFPLFGSINAPFASAQPHCYRATSGRFEAGSWTGSPFELDTMTTGHDTFVYLLEGSLSIEQDDDLRHRFGPGDAFLVESGTRCRCTGQQKIHLCFAAVGT